MCVLCVAQVWDRVREYLNYHFQCVRVNLWEHIRCLIAILFIAMKCIFWANCVAAAVAAMLYGNVVYWAIHTESVVISLVRAGEYFFFMFALSKPIHTEAWHSVRRSELRSLAILLFTHNNCERAKKKRHSYTQAHTCSFVCLLTRSFPLLLTHILSKWTYNLNGKQAGRQSAS